MVNSALAFTSSFLFFALKSWQQFNVVHKKYWWILPTSMAMALCEVYVVATVAKMAGRYRPCHWFRSGTWINACNMVA
jgi:hypothetical protein